MKKIISFLTICLTSLILVKTVVASDFKSNMKSLESIKITNSQLAQMNLYLDPSTIPTQSKLSYSSCKRLQPKYKLTTEKLYAIKYFVNDCESYNNMAYILNAKDLQVITETQAPNLAQSTDETKVSNETQAATKEKVITETQASPPTQVTPTTQAPTTQATVPTQGATSASASDNLNNVNTSSNFREFQKKVIEIVNKERVKAGLISLAENADSDKIATLKSEDMVKLNYFSHTSPTYGSPFEMLSHFNIKYSAAGENIAYGQSTPDEVMTAWMNSPGHRANILNSNFTQIGVGIALKANGQLVWTQTFTRP